MFKYFINEYLRKYNIKYYLSDTKEIVFCPQLFKMIYDMMTDVSGVEKLLLNINFGLSRRVQFYLYGNNYLERFFESFGYVMGSDYAKLAIEKELYGHITRYTNALNKYYGYREEYSNKKMRDFKDYVHILYKIGLSSRAIKDSLRGLLSKKKYLNDDIISWVNDIMGQ
jgi:hypothetical protein